MSAKNKNNNAKSTITVCLIGAVVLMGVLAGWMKERFNTKRSNYNTRGCGICQQWNNVGGDINENAKNV